MIAIFTTAYALAQDAQPLAPYPSAPEPVLGECADVLGLEVGRPVPDVLAGQDSIVRCAAVALPVSQQADLLAIEAWSVACREQYVLIVQADAQTIAGLTVDRDRWRDLALERADDVVELRRWYRQPIVMAGLGAVSVGVAIGGGAFLVAAL